MLYGKTLMRRIGIYGLVAIAVGISLAATLTLLSKSHTYQNSSYVVAEPAITPFPIGVDPANATITEQIIVDDFYNEYLAQSSEATNSWWTKVAATLQTNQIYQQLASPVSRIIVVWPGERTEQITKNIGDVLRWNSTDRALFVSLMNNNELALTQGIVPPGQYVTHRSATPEDIASQLQTTFTTTVTDRYTDELNTVLPIKEALTIASLIEREASDFENMREISGVIWNRLFINMPLQLDASLQYVKAQNPYETNWWPAVRPQDKFIDSPFNTYQNKGLPPEPIANPSVEAIVAALNPRVTDCIYYFHSRTADYYCSVEYEEHVRKLREVYGTGS
jgi:cell division protein YceG involved in septum cleavage